MPEIVANNLSQEIKLKNIQLYKIIISIIYLEIIQLKTKRG